jgi:hypothetical protein
LLRWLAIKLEAAGAPVLNYLSLINSILFAQTTGASGSGRKDDGAKIRQVYITAVLIRLKGLSVKGQIAVCPSFCFYIYKRLHGRTLKEIAAQTASARKLNGSEL